MPHDVFISYATEDKTTALAVCFGLEQAGIRCWMAPRDIQPSENYDDAIIRAIDASRVMVVIFSSNIFQSQYVKSEVEYAFSKDLVIAPFRIEAVTPQGGMKLYLDRKHWLDAMTPPLENHIQTLVKIIQGMLDLPIKLHEQVPPPPPHKTGLLANPKFIIGAGVGVLAILILIFALVSAPKGTGDQANVMRATSTAADPTIAAPTLKVQTQEPTAALPDTQVPPTQPVQPVENTPVTPPPAAFSSTWLLLDGLPRTINDFEVDPADPKVVYAATGDYAGSGAGVYKSLDAGLTWQPSASGLPQQSVLALTVVQADAPVLLAATEYDVFASRDGGSTWTSMGSPFTGGGSHFKAFIPSGDRKTVLAVVEYLGIVRSDNAGQSWTQIGEGLPMEDKHALVQSLAVDPTNSQIVFAGTGGFVGGGAGVYKSIDGGETWTASNKGMLDYYITALAIDPANSEVVYAGSNSGDLFKSADGGKTWTNLSERLKVNPNQTPRDIRSIQIDPVSGQVNLVADNAGIMYSSDGGNKWRSIGNPPNTDQPSFSSLGIIFGEKMVFLAAVPGMTVGGGWRYGESQPAPTAQPAVLTTPAKTVNLSGVWQNVSDLPRAVAVVAVNPANPKQVLAGVCEVFGDGALYQSVDGGLTWQKAPGWTGKGVEAIAFSGGSSPTIYATSGTGGEVYVSQDGGSTWNLAGKSVATGSFSARLAASASDPQNVYYIGDPALSSSNDGGQSWQPAGDGLPAENQNAQVLSITVDPKDSKIVYAGTGGFVGGGMGVYKSSDSGLTWTPTNKNMLDYVITALAVDPINSQIVYAGSGSGDFFKSTDGAQTWTNLTEKLKVAQYGLGEIRSIQVDPLTGILYVAADSVGVVYSSDGGGKWRLLANPSSLNQPSWTSFGMAFGEKPVIFFATKDTGVWRFGPNP